jgi:hypothetical protein
LYEKGSLRELLAAAGFAVMTGVTPVMEAVSRARETQRHRDRSHRTGGIPAVSANAFVNLERPAPICSMRTKRLSVRRPSRCPET